MIVYLKLDEKVAPWSSISVYPEKIEDSYPYELLEVAEIALDHPVFGITFMSGWENYGQELISVLMDMNGTGLKLMFHTKKDWGNAKIKLYESLTKDNLNLRKVKPPVDVKIIVASMLLDDAYTKEYHVLVGKYDEKQQLPDGFAGIEKISFNQRFITVQGE